MIIRPQNAETLTDLRRREFLVQALSMGLLAGGAGWNLPALAEVLGKLPSRLPEGKSIFDMQGDVTVNGQRPGYDTLIRPTDLVSVGEDGYCIAVVGDSAMIVRRRSAVQLSGEGRLLRSLRLAKGGLLMVIGHRSAAQDFSVRSNTVTVGIRGTGFYADADPEKTYFCTCYGTTELSAIANPSAREQIVSRHHDAARYVLAEPDRGRYIIPAPFINHTDLELMTIEALVGRSVPFGIPGTEYGGPRREY